jgi:hypothetical protein
MLAELEVNPVRGRDWKIVYLLYLDDAGVTGTNLSDRQQPYHVLTAVPIRETTWCDVEKLLLDLANKRVPRSEQPKFEFHAQDIFNGSGGIFKKNRAFWTPQRRFELFEEFLKVIADCKLPIIYAAVHKRRLRDQYNTPYNPRDLAFLLCAERVERWFCQDAPDEKGMFIADETSASGKAALRKSLRQYRRIPIPLGIRNEKLEHVIETIHFVDSRESLGVQIADACSYLIKRHHCRKANSEDFYKIIKGNVVDWKVFP